MEEQNEIRNVIIIGSGPAGWTAALYTGRANLAPLVIEGYEWGGQLMNTTDVENYPGFPDGVLGPEMMELFKKQCSRFGAEIITADVDRVDFSERPFKVWVGDQLYLGKSVIISTGAEYRHLGIPGEEKYAGHGISWCATCDGFFFKDEELAVIGGGDSAMEEALFLTKFASKVTVIHRRDELRASGIMQDRAFANDKIEFVWDTVPEEFVGDDTKVTGVKTRNVKTGEESVLPVGGVFVAIGHDPSTKLFEGHIDLDDQGYILVDEPSTFTSVEGIFAGGDCVDATYRQAVTAAGMGCKAAMDAENWVAEQEHIG